jgi:uncharacterized protein (TIGR02594 family)
MTSGTNMTPVDFTPYPWMAFAFGEVGQHEVKGTSANNPRIQEYLAAASLPHDPDETPWCSAFVNWCMKQAGIQGTGRANARSWLSWGPCLAKPTYGAVTILWRDKRNGAKGHVAFYTGERQGSLVLLGGNQDNQVKIKDYGSGRLLGYRWPPGFARPA